MTTPKSPPLIWKIFLVFAVYPLTSPNVTTPSGQAHRFWLVWRVMVLTVSCLLIAYTYWQREAIMYYEDIAGQVNDILQYVSLALTCVVVEVEAFRKQACYLAIWKIIARVQKLGQLSQADRQLSKFFAVQFWVCLSIFIGVQVRILTQILKIDDDQWLRMWIVNLLPLTICYLMTLLHIFFLNMLACYFQYVQHELKEVVTLAKYSMYVTLDRVIITRRLDTLRDIYGLLYEVSENVNAIFVWSQAFNLTRMFLQCTCDLHWFYKEFEHNFPVLFFNFAPPTACFLLLLHHSTKCVERARSLAALLFQIKVMDEEVSLQRLIHHFSAQLSHEPVSFGGLDLFTINYGLLRTMVTGIVTYIIIFIQMTPPKV